MIALMLAMGLLQADAGCHVAGAPPPRGCTAWSPLFRNLEAEVSADPASVVRRTGGFDLTLRIVLAADRPTGMRTGIVTYRFDCAGATATLLRARYYTAAGRLLEEGPPPSGRALASPPGSPNRLALDRFCPASGGTR